ncbi:MAG: gamma-glutamyltransferase [Nannocystaceae bacterium]
MVRAEKGCIAAGHPKTAEAGATILAAGGNAFDAAIAALWMSCVAEPVLASLGGGGFCLTHGAGGDSRIYDFFAQTPRRRRAPAEVDFQPIYADFGVTTQGFHIGVGAAATPGLVRGIFALHRARGSLPMRELVGPAIAAAAGGVTITPFQAYLLSVIGPIYTHTPAARALFTVEDGADEAGAPRRRLWQAGDRVTNPDLADALDALAREGDALFYGDDDGGPPAPGTIAAAISRLSADHGGHLDADDLRSYRTLEREPLRLGYRDAHLLTNPPPASGGLLIAFGLALLAGHDVSALSFADPDRAALLAAVMAATRDARRDRGVTPELLDPALLRAYAEALAAPPATRGTTHISVIDRDANAASITVSNGEGCGAIIPGTGSMLNNMLGEEDINPGGADAWPLDARMGSMMAPTAIFADDGRLCVLGSGGSKRIRTAILQVLVNLIDHRMSLREAVEAPRIHLEGARLNWEAGLPAEVAEALARAYPEHTAWPERNMYFGGVHAVIREADGELHGVGDPRRAGVCLGDARDAS